MALSEADYARLLALRSGLRHFEAWSAEQARAGGLSPASHQLLLAIRGHTGPAGPTIGEVADYLLLRHHSAVGRVDRAEAAGLVVRLRDDHDHRVVRLRLTELGEARLEALTALHVEELRRLGLDVPWPWAGLEPVQAPHGSGPLSVLTSVSVASVYDVPPSDSDAVLVDRRWPARISRDRAPFGRWLRDVAPSAELRRWYGQAPGRFAEFARRYRRQLQDPPAKVALEELRELARDRGVVLVTAAADLDRSAAAVLQAVVTDR